MPSNSLLHRLITTLLNNPIVASLLTVFIVTIGLLSLDSIRQETSPSYQVQEISIALEYPGATPNDIEQSIVIPIESHLSDLPDIKQIDAQIGIDHADMTLELVDGINPHAALSQVKAIVAGISSLPRSMESPVIELVREVQGIMEIAIIGELPQWERYVHANTLKQKMLRELDIASIELQGVRQPEIHIETSPIQLEKYQLTLEQIVSKVSLSLHDIPAGSIELNSGEYLLRTLGNKEDLASIKRIAIKTTPRGEVVQLSQVAQIYHGFSGSEQPFLVNGETAMVLKISQLQDSNPITLSQDIQSFLADYQASLPKHIKLLILEDESQGYAQRLGLLTNNGMFGMLLVVIVLTLFLDFRLAFWVSLGIPIAFIGTLGLMPLFNVPLNMLTLFAFILTLGVVVDDAVVIAEDIYQRIQQGMPAKQAIKSGTSAMAVPVIIAVSTNIIAFIPLFFVPGSLGVMYQPMTLLIIAVFVVSIVEALIILPLHLANLTPSKPSRLTLLSRLQQRSVVIFENLKQKKYRPLLNSAIANPTMAIILFCVFSSITYSWVASGRVDVSFVPKIESTRVDAEVEFIAGTPLSDRLAILNHIDQVGQDVMTKISATKGYKFRMTEVESTAGSVTFLVLPQQQRQYVTADFVNQWRIAIGELPSIKSLFFDYQVGPGGGKELVLELTHPNQVILSQAMTSLSQQLQQITGLSDLDSSLLNTKRQYNLTPNALGTQLGFSSDELGNQVRLRAFGQTAKRQIINGDEIKVRVLGKKYTHKDSEQISQLKINTPNGETIYLGQVATIAQLSVAQSIERVDGRAISEITANIIRQQANASVIFDHIQQQILPKLQDDFPQLTVELGGNARTTSQVSSELVNGIVLALFLIFSVLAILFRNYLDAFIVLLTIPFTLSAAVFGHIIMGYDFSVMSLFGMIALSGLVINGSVHILLRAKQLTLQGESFDSALTHAALARFRPVVITALTTTAGLVPLLFETSTQALYLIPMVISLSFGTVFSIAVTMLLTPALFKYCYDLKQYSTPITKWTKYRLP